MYGHAWDEDPETLVVGVEELSEWLAQPGNLESTIEGYQINDLSDESVANIDEKERKIEDTIVGTAVALPMKIPSVMSFKSILLKIGLKFMKEHMKTMKGFSLRVKSCLIDQGCMESEYDSASTSKWAGLITVSAKIWSNKLV